MCGIAGWISPDGSVDAGTLSAMRDRLAHRGPDGSGLWVSQDRRVGLAHRRLSIIDLSESAGQPMHAPDRMASVVFNGEIYNHRALRAELEERGVRFRTSHSDTEVLLLGYLEWGLDELLRRLIGMFAFVVHDARTGRVVCVRDRIGVKPFYFSRVGTDFYFASEAKGLFASPRIEARLDDTAFHQWLSFRAVPAPRTLFQGIETLAAGELCELDVASGSLTRRRWWDPLESRMDPPATLEEARDRVAEITGDSVDHRLVSDVPVGLFLSGGVDSAWLLNLMSERRGGISTYTVTYPGHAAYDEGQDAGKLAHEHRSDHREVPLRSEDFARAMIDVAWHQDEPIAAPVCTSVYFLARAARDSGVPVVLAGEGADELFCGYESWIKLRDLEHVNRALPDLPGRLLRKGAHALASACMPWTSPYPEILRRAAAGTPLFQGGALDFSEAAKARLVGAAVSRDSADVYQQAIEPIRKRFLVHGDPRDVTAWMSYADLAFRLPQLMLPRLDKMGMAASIEGRVPYLDHRLVELVLGLPPEWRGAKGKIGKPLVKSVMARDLPHDFVYRRKQGFQAPVKEWKDSALGDRYLPALVEFARRTELFDPTALQSLLGHSGDRLYFSLTNFMLWYLLYVEHVLTDVLPEVARPELTLESAA